LLKVILNNATYCLDHCNYSQKGIGQDLTIAYKYTRMVSNFPFSLSQMIRFINAIF
jgi:hypothetical protein